MMLWVSFLICIAFVPGITGASIPTGWAAMSLTLPWLIWKRIEMTAVHWLLLAFVAYAAASLLWTPQREDGLEELWHLTLFCLAFVVGARLGDLSGVWKGLALGAGVSSAIAIVQWHYGSDWQILPNSNWSKPPGLFFNNAVAGAVAAIVVVGCFFRGMRWWALLPLPLLVLSQSRGAWFAVVASSAAAMVVRMRWVDRIFLGIVLLDAVGLALLFLHGASDGIRMMIWHGLVDNLSLQGHGAGASQAIFLNTGNEVFHIEHAHNDYLQFAYEYGLGAVPLAIALWLMLEQTDAAAWPPFVCCSILAGYFWVMEAPVPLFAFGTVAGSVASSLGLAWADGRHRGLGKLLWYSASRWSHGSPWRKPVPV